MTLKMPNPPFGTMSFNKPSSSPASQNSQRMQQELQSQQKILEQIKMLLAQAQQHQNNLLGMAKQEGANDSNSRMVYLKTQQTMTQQSQVMQTISNIVKMYNDTSNALVNNLR